MGARQSCYVRHFYPRSPCGERHQILDDTSGATYHFYPRSPCGERRVTVLGIQHRCGISIHALLAESDWWLRCWQLAARDISIHALLAESDVLALCFCGGACDFYPRSPCGERLSISVFLLPLVLFLSTLSLRRATRD